MLEVLCVALSISLILCVVRFKKEVSTLGKKEFINNKFLRDILKMSFKKETAYEASKDIIRSLSKKYELDYCSLYKFDPEQQLLETLYSTVEEKYLKDLQEYANDNFKKMKEGEAAAIRILKNVPLDYKTANERDIRYSYFMPLKLDSYLIGALLIENKTDEEIKGFEIEFFELVFENIAITIRHLILFESIVNAANTDNLTKTYNKHYMYKFLNEKISLKREFSISLFDIDFFKKFNDTHGHLFGDRVLIEVSKLVKESIGEGNCLFRYGGEEFIIYLATSDLQEAYIHIDEIRKKIEEMYIEKEDRTKVNVTCSFGISLFTNSINETIQRADEALYKSKENGRNTVNVYK